MRSFYGADICELVGLFILSQLQHLKLNIRLYRDDGLAVSSLLPRQVENCKKEIFKIFKTHNLNITIEANLKILNFLDVTLDLNSDTFAQFIKPNDTPLYVHCQSNHPPNILKNIPLAINKRLSSISSNENIFKQASPVYQKALQDSGYKHQ